MAHGVCLLLTTGVSALTTACRLQSLHLFVRRSNGRMPNPLRSTRGILATTAAVGIVLALDVAAEKSLYGRVDGILLTFTVHPIVMGFVGWEFGGRRGFVIGAL